MKMSTGATSLRLKISLLVIALVLAGATLYYTQNLITKLQGKERQIVQLYAKSLEYIGNTISQDSDITFLFDNVIKPIDFPLIMTDANDEVKSKDDIKNVKYDSTLSLNELTKVFADEINEMDKIHPPIQVTYADTIVLTKIHYGDSDLINQLKFYPILQIIIAALFILLGYIGFSNIKSNEQSNIWVGMAKETAHQFGTPISSLMGWLEMLKINYKDKDKVLDIADEIDNDVEKLRKITYRFSKIGATPEIQPKVVYSEIFNVLSYFERRLPQSGRNVELKISGNENIKAKINTELFEWVIENLIKNALDAIENKKGRIFFTIKDSRKFVDIEISDNGKGIDLKRRKDVFRPGYSTKRRGWGLGLSLSKRIIEDYHGGKISVKTSIPGEGTTFKILLNKA